MQTRLNMELVTTRLPTHQHTHVAPLRRARRRALEPRRRTLFVVCLATAMLMLDVAVVNTALPHIGADLGSGTAPRRWSGLQWVIDAYVLAMATGVLTAGSLADRLGRRRIFGTGLVVFTGASLACGLAGTLTALDVARAVQGFGAALLFASTLALLAAAFPSGTARHNALAAYGATIGASFAMGPLVGGAVTEGVGWRWVFLLNVPLGILAFALTARGVPESRSDQRRRIDWAGQAILGAGLLGIVLGLLRGNLDGWSNPSILAELGGGLGLLCFFAAFERRVAEPMLPRRLFGRAFTGAQVATFAVSASFYAIYLYTTVYLQHILGLSALSSGLVYMLPTALTFAVSALTPRLLMHASAEILVVAGLGLIAAGLTLSLLTGPHSSWTALVPGMTLCGIGAGAFNPAVRAVALAAVSPADSGVASGANDTFNQAGTAVGVAAYGAMIPAATALGAGSAGAFVHGLHLALLAGAGVALLGAVITARVLMLPAPEPDRLNRPRRSLWPRHKTQSSTN